MENINLDDSLFSLPTENKIYSIEVLELPQGLSLLPSEVFQIKMQYNLSYFMALQYAGFLIISASTQVLTDRNSLGLTSEHLIYLHLNLTGFVNLFMQISPISKIKAEKTGYPEAKAMKSIFPLCFIMTA